MCANVGVRVDAILGRSGNSILQRRARGRGADGVAPEREAAQAAVMGLGSLKEPVARVPILKESHLSGTADHLYPTRVLTSFVGAALSPHMPLEELSRLMEKLADEVVVA